MSVVFDSVEVGHLFTGRAVLKCRSDIPEKIKYECYQSDP